MHTAVAETVVAVCATSSVVYSFAMHATVVTVAANNVATAVRTGNTTVAETKAVTAATNVATNGKTTAKTTTTTNRNIKAKTASSYGLAVLFYLQQNKPLLLMR